MQSQIFRSTFISILCLSVLGIGSFISCAKKRTPTSETDTDGPSTVKVILNLPPGVDANGKAYTIYIDGDKIGENGFVKMGTGAYGTERTVEYTFPDVPAGTYYIYAFVFTVSNGREGAQSGDYTGFYGGTLNDPPYQPNAVILASSTITFSFGLDIIP